MVEKLAIGVDFGATKLIAGVVSLRTGQLLGIGKKKTRHVQGANDFIKRIVGTVDEAVVAAGIDTKQLVGIGIGAAGMVNREEGIVLKAANLGVSKLPIVSPLELYYGLPCKLGNDVEVATLGELKFGAGRGCDNFVCIFVGTGIGSGIVLDGKIYRGASGVAGELGHTVLYPAGRSCGCGALGCLETYASRGAIARLIVDDLAQGAHSVVKDKVETLKGSLRAKTIAEALEIGDELVMRHVTQAAQYLGYGIATVINFLNPKRIILGGGLVEACDLYFQIACNEAYSCALKPATAELEIVRAELGDYAGIIGAALLLENAW